VYRGAGKDLPSLFTKEERKTLHAQVRQVSEGARTVKGKKRRSKFEELEGEKGKTEGGGKTRDRRQGGSEGNS
jgi:hypothetical protein